MTQPPSSDARRFAPAASRNRDPILDILRPHLRAGMTVLEIASGSGEHAVHFSRALPETIFHPSDPDPDARASIDAHARESGANLRPALALDVTATWPDGPFDAILCINMIHISPWNATIALMRSAGARLAPNGFLFVYGPFRRGGAHTAPSNAAFDESLRQRDPAWGVRDLEQVIAQAASAGMSPAAIQPMPANNLSVFFRRLPPASP